MRLPGFNAEASIGRTAEMYHRHTPLLKPVVHPSRAEIIASLDNSTSGSCGSCAELKWPNGTGTGVCRQDCCDVLGRCELKSCACSGSSGSSTSVFQNRASVFRSFALRR